MRIRRATAPGDDDALVYKAGWFMRLLAGFSLAEGKRQRRSSHFKPGLDQSNRAGLASQRDMVEVQCAHHEHTMLVG